MFELQHDPVKNQPVLVQNQTSHVTQKKTTIRPAFVVAFIVALTWFSFPTWLIERYFNSTAPLPKIEKRSSPPVG